MVEQFEDSGASLEAKACLKKESLVFADSTFLSLAEKIEHDYKYILRNLVLPRLKGAVGLKLREFRILTALHLSKEPLCPNGVSEILQFDPATVTRAVSILSSAGYVERAENPLDLRSVHLELTPQGETLARDFVETANYVISELESGSSEIFDEKDTRSLLKSLRKISRRSETLKDKCVKTMRLQLRRAKS